MSLNSNAATAVIVFSICMVLASCFYTQREPTEALAVCIKKCWTNDCVRICGEASRRARP